MTNKQYIKTYISLQTLILLFTSCGRETTFTLEDGITINNITVITANDEKVASLVGYVVIDGNEIVYVDKKKPSLRGNFKEIDGNGKFMIPGLMDSHVHLANTAGFNGQLKEKYPELVKAYFKQLPRSYLYHGFTTLIDVNNYAPHLISQIKNSALHPDIFTCGNQVQVMDDFMMEMEEYTAEIRYQFQFLHDKYNEEISFPDSINLEKHTAREIVTTIKAQDGVGVKLAYEDEASGLNVSWAKPSKSILSDLVSEAKRQNLPLLLHAPSLEGHQIGLASGVQVFAHGLWNWTANFKEEFHNLELTPDHKEVLLQIAQNKIGYQLTFRAIVGEEDLISEHFSFDKNLDHIYPKAYLDVLRSKEGDWGRKKILGRSDFLKKKNPPFYEAIRGNHISDELMWPAVYHLYRSRLNTVAKFLSDHNANFILGSDSPAMNMFTNPPGYNGFLEMTHMYEAGIPLKTIFRAATFNNVKTFHLEDLYGGVEKNKIANLLILKSNPLETINAYNDIEIVIIGGKAIPREKLSATGIK